MKPLYFDTAATTAVAPEVLARMVELLGGEGAYANPSSAAHLPGQAAAAVVALARVEIAAELGCEADEVVSRPARPRRTIWRCAASHWPMPRRDAI